MKRLVIALLLLAAAAPVTAEVTVSGVKSQNR